MIDKFERKIDYIRISVTDLCNLRCVYCMPEEGIPRLNCQDILSYEDIYRLCKIFAALGIQKIKITGGEPLARKDIHLLIKMIKSIDGIEHVTLTTNGILLPEKVHQLKDAGIDGINVSFDSEDANLFTKITRFDKCSAAVNGIDAAIEAGIPNIKLNSVIIKNLNEKQIIPIIEFAKKRNIAVRFIEMMPIGLGNYFEMMSQDEVMRVIKGFYGDFNKSTGKIGNGPAEYYSVDGFSGKIGFISAVSHKFCDDCNRVRLTSTGFLKTCLQYDIGRDLKTILLEEKDDFKLMEIVRQTIFDKPLGHRFGEICPSKDFENKGMSQIGG